jgi:hypothetical protein
MAKSKKQQGHDAQASAFITSLHGAGWRSLNSFEDGGHVFELLSRGQFTILMQLYPNGHGFQVWRPVTESSSIAETRVAIELYAQQETTGNDQPTGPVSEASESPNKDAK